MNEYKMVNETTATSRSVRIHHVICNKCDFKVYHQDATADRRMRGAKGALWPIMVGMMKRHIEKAHRGQNGEQCVIESRIQKDIKS